MVWGSPGRILIDFELSSDWKSKEISLRQPRADEDIALPLYRRK